MEIQARPDRDRGKPDRKEKAKGLGGTWREREGVGRTGRLLGERGSKKVFRRETNRDF